MKFAKMVEKLVEMKKFKVDRSVLPKEARVLNENLARWVFIEHGGFALIFTTSYQSLSSDIVELQKGKGSKEVKRFFQVLANSAILAANKGEEYKPTAIAIKTIAEWDTAQK